MRSSRVSKWTQKQILFLDITIVGHGFSNQVDKWSCRNIERFNEKITTTYLSWRIASQYSIFLVGGGEWPSSLIVLNKRKTSRCDGQD
jgi:hypothetical protein